MATASIAVRLNAITGEFETAFKGATRTVAGFEKAFAGAASSIKGQQEGINRAFAAFSGDKLIAESNQLAAAITKVGGASKLTAAEQQRVNATVTEAIAKYKALGQDAPASLQALARATQQVAAVAQPATLASKALGVLGSTFGQFTAANLAASAINNVIGKLGEFVAQGSKLPGLEASFNKLSKTVNQDSAAMLSALQTGTRGLVSNIDLMQSANKAILLGLPVTSKEMGELAKTATILGKAMGQDATSSLNDLITALGRSSPLILDNLGLTVKVGEANEAYAKKLGKTASQLTDAESKMAFYEAAMEAARKKTAEIGEQTKTLGEIVETVWVAIGNSVTRSASVVNVGVGKALSSTKELLLFLQQAAANGVPLAILQANERAAAAAKGATGARPDVNLPASNDQQIALLREQAKALADTALKPLTAAQRELTIAFDKGGKSAKDIADALNAVKATAGVSEEQIKRLLDAQKGSTKTANDYQEALKRVAAAQIPLTRAQTEQIDALLKAKIGHSDIAKVVRVSEVAVDSYADAQKQANETLRDLEKIVRNANGELGKLPGTLVPTRDLIRDISVLLPPAVAKMQDLVGFTGVGKVIVPIELGFPDDGVKEFEARMGEVRAKVADVANSMRGLGSLFDNVFGRIVSGAADVVQGIGNILTATTAWGKAMAIVDLALSLASKAINLFRDEAHEATNDIRDDFLATFGPGGTGIGSGFSNLAAQLAKVNGGTVAFNALLSAKTPEDFGRAMERVNQILASTPEALAGAAGFQTKAALEKIAADSVRVFEYMRDSGLYTAEAVQEAWERAQAALVASGDASAAAADKATAAIDKLKGELKSLTESIADEAPEEVMGVIEQQARAKIAAIEEQIKLEEVKAEAAKQAGLEATGEAKRQADELDGYLKELFGRGYVVPIEFIYELPEFPSISGGGIPQLASGGIVRRPTLALIGERGPEAVVPLSNLSRISPESGSVTTIVQLEGRTVAELTAPYMPGAARRYVRA
jgi:hypothetical protein